MTSEELILETQNSSVYAPSSRLVPEVTVDDELTRSIEQIPDKMAFKIGEVAELLKVKAYVLRYWESEFDALKPIKSKNNQRMYKKSDVVTAFMIKKLLYKDRFSIAGARKALRNLKKDNKKVKAIKSTAQHMEGLCEQVDDLLVDIARLRQLFI